MKKILLILSLITYPLFQCYSQIIVTDAGNGTAGYSGDGGQASASEIHGPYGVACDASGNIYVADVQNSRIRKISKQTGVIITFAGNGTAGFSGNGGQATAAEINTPQGIIVDASGNIYFSDQANQIVRKISTSGVISTFAGNRMGSYGGDGGQATIAGIHNPVGLAVDGSGNIYIADAANNRIRKVNTSGVISTFAGNGTAAYSGDGGQATAAEIKSPNDVGFDGSGNLFIADAGNNRIRKVNTSGVISSFAGNGTAGFNGDGGQATAALLHTPSSVKVDASGDVYLVDNANNRVREVKTSGVISTVTGNGTAGYSGDAGQATAAEINTPALICFDALGDYYIGDNSNNRIREIYLYINVTTSIITNVSCNGGSNGSASATPTHGTSPYTYSWTGGQTTSTATGLTAGTYTVTVTDSKSLTGTATAIITQPTALSVTATAKSASVCPGNSDSLKCTPSGGVSPYTYNWLPAPYADMSCSTCQNTKVYPFGTTFTITVTDAHGCTATASTSITVNPFPYTTITGTFAPNCASSPDTLVALGLVSSYAWSTGATTSSIIVSPSVSTTYTLEVKNSYGCSDSLQYVVDTDCIGNGRSSSTPTRIVPSTTCNPSSYTSDDSVAWFYFTPTDSNNQIVAISYAIGIAVPHVHRLTLYDSALNMIEDEHLPDINGATELRIDASHLKIGHKYLVCAARTGAHSNTPGCNPTPTPTGICNESMRWSFEICFRSFPVFVPKDSSSEAPSVNQLYYENRGQVMDLNQIPRYDIKAYSKFAFPGVSCSDSAISFIYSKLHKYPSIADSFQRVDMIPTGSAVQPYQRLFKTEKDSSAGYLNYFLGLVPNGITNVYGYSRVVYKNIYTNIDMHVYSNTAGTKLYFVCNTGGTTHPNPANIELKFNGATSVNVTPDSGLNVVTSLGTLSFAPGFAYEDSAGIIVAKSWKANFEKVSANVVRFHTGAFNTSEPLIIEVDKGHHNITSTSNLNWSTYFSGGGDQFNGVSTDATGNVLAAGQCETVSFPVLAGFQMTTGNTFGINNAVITKFNSGTNLIWSTYFGGLGPDFANNITTDSAGNVFVTGYTYSANFPVYQNPIYTNCYYSGVINNGNPTCNESDAFIIDLNSAGNSRNWVTYYGGCDGIGANSEGEIGTHLVIDRLKNLYVVGGHQQAFTPLTLPNVPTFRETGAYNSDSGTAFILKFNINSSNVSTFGKRLWATDIGGTVGSPSTTCLYGCAVDTNNNFFTIGIASESGFPTLHGTSTYYGFGDFVITKFDATTNVIDWSTYYGGDGEELAPAIVTDNSGNCYVTGSTNSPAPSQQIPIVPISSPGYNQGYTYVGAGNAFIAEYNPAGTLSWSTYFGNGNPSGFPSPYVYANSIAIFNNHDLYISGYADTNGLVLPSGGNPAGTYNQTADTGVTFPNCFVAAFDIVNLKYEWGTYFGGNSGDHEYSVAVDPVNKYLYMVGSTTSPDFPRKNAGGYFNGTYVSGPMDAFISRFDLTNSINAGINGVRDSPKNIVVYPNPALNSITVQVDLTQKQKVEFIVYNSIGQLVYDNIISGEKGRLNHEINVSLLADGLYLIKVNVGDNIFIKKFVKQD